MALKFAYTRPDGGVTIFHAASKAHLERLFGEMTDADYRAHVMERAIPSDAASIIELPEDWVSPDRASRDDWVIVDGKVKVRKK